MHDAKYACIHAGGCGMYVSSSIVDETNPIKARPLQVEDQYIPTRLHQTNFGFIMSFSKPTKKKHLLVA